MFHSSHYLPHHTPPFRGSARDHYLDALERVRDAEAEYMAERLSPRRSYSRRPYDLDIEYSSPYGYEQPSRVDRLRAELAEAEELEQLRAYIEHQRDVERRQQEQQRLKALLDYEREQHRITAARQQQLRRQQLEAQAAHDLQRQHAHRHQQLARRGCGHACDTARPRTVHFGDGRLPSLEALGTFGLGQSTKPELSKSDLKRAPAVKRRSLDPSDSEIHVEVDLGNLLKSFGLDKETSPRPKRKCCAQRKETVQPEQRASSAEVEIDIGGVLEKFLGVKPESQSESAAAEAPAPSSSTSKPASQATARTEPEKKEQNKTSGSSSDFAHQTFPFQHLLKQFLGPLQQQQSTPRAQPAVKPESGSWDLQRLLEKRLTKEDEEEVRDTIQAILMSLTDSGPENSSAPSASASASASGSGKGKEKEVAPETKDPSQASSKDVMDSFSSVENIAASFQALTSDFRFPAKLDFTPSSSRASSPNGQPESTEGLSEPSIISKLSFTANNAPLRYYESSLTSLMGQLDAIDSFGNEEVRLRRKNVVQSVEEKLEEVEREVHGRWRGWNAQQHKVDGEKKEENVVVKSLPRSEPQSESQVPEASGIGKEEVKDVVEKEESPDTSARDVASTTDEVKSDIPVLETSPAPVAAVEEPEPSVLIDELSTASAAEVSVQEPEMVSLPADEDLSSAPAEAVPGEALSTYPPASYPPSSASVATLRPAEAQAESVSSDEEPYLLAQSHEEEVKKGPKKNEETDSDWSEVDA